MSVLRLGTNLRNQLVVRVLRKSAKLLSIIKFVNGFDKNISLGTRSSWLSYGMKRFLLSINIQECVYGGGGSVREITVEMAG